MPPTNRPQTQTLPETHMSLTYKKKPRILWCFEGLTNITYQYQWIGYSKQNSILPTPITQKGVKLPRLG